MKRNPIKDLVEMAPSRFDPEQNTTATEVQDLNYEHHYRFKMSNRKEIWQEH